MLSWQAQYVVCNKKFGLIFSAIELPDIGDSRRYSQFPGWREMQIRVITFRGPIFQKVRQKKMIRNIIGLIVGYVVGSVVNFGLIMANMAIMPAGTDFSTTEAVNAAMGSLQPVNFALVFLAHALGALVGAWVSTLIAVSHKLKIAIFIGALFLLGGIYAAVAINAPFWFEAADILFAYIPFALLGAKLGGAWKSTEL